MKSTYDVVICGAGIAGIATAYYLSQHGVRDVLLVDKHPPMTHTSAKSGECYRNWWPHPAMAQFMNRSLDLLDTMARDSDNFFHMNRRGYAYVSSQSQSAQIARFADLPVGSLRFHDHAPVDYAFSQDWDGSLMGADILQDRTLIAQHFPYLSETISTVIHARRAGWLSAQQLGTYLLDEARNNGVHSIRGVVSAIEVDARGIFAVVVQGASSQQRIATRTTKMATGDLALLGQASTQQRIATRAFVNAAGPYLNEIAAMMGLSLSIENVLHQKVVIQDIHGVVPRSAPFTIYLDEQTLDWSDEERAFLEASPEDRWLLEKFPGGLHVRPEGGADSNWIKLGWAFNRTPALPHDEPHLPETFPEVVIRGAGHFVPGLRQYVNAIPKPMLYEGGFYTRTTENLPLIGPLAVSGAYVVGALSGFGIMAAPAAGELVSRWITEAEVPAYAQQFAVSRYDDPAYLEQIRNTPSGEL